MICLPGEEQEHLGKGLITLKNRIIPTKAGLIKDFNIEYSQKRVFNMLTKYIPTTKDLVIGIVNMRLSEQYKVDIGGPHLAMLGYCAFEGASKRNRPILQPGDIIYARVTFADKDMDPEIECINANGKSDGMGPLAGGYLVTCSTGMAKQLMDPKNIILNAAAELSEFEVVVGLNGRVWISSKDVKTSAILVSMIKHCDGMDPKAIASHVAKTIRKYRG
jgi:exosome complex component RRP40